MGDFRSILANFLRRVFCPKGGISVRPATASAKGCSGGPRARRGASACRGKDCNNLCCFFGRFELISYFCISQAHDAPAIDICIPKG